MNSSETPKPLLTRIRDAEFLRAPARRVRAWLVARMHPVVRRRAQEQTRSLPPRPNVLFICLGNICRSPYAAEALRTRAADRLGNLASAGFIGPGRPSPFEAVDEAALRGVDLTPHRSRIVVPDDVRDFHLLVVMEAGQSTRLQRELGVPSHQILLLGDLDPVTPDRRLIPDPFGRGPGAFREAYDRIDRTLEAFLEHLPRGG